MITVTGFKWVPPIAQGVVRDLRVRWALEEAGLAYRERLISVGAEQAGPAYRALQPFGQVPALEEDGLVLFESGAIVLYIGERSEVLLPKDPAGRARAVTWLLSALNTVEIVVQSLVELDLFYAGEAWARARKPGLEAATRRRLGELATALGDRDYLEGEFTAGDLMMSAVLRIARDSDLLDDFVTLKAYRARCEARPAFQRALAAQMAPFATGAPPT